MRRRAFLGDDGYYEKYDIFVVHGDSNADGRGDTITTVPADTLFLWDGSALTEITTQTVSNDGVYGSAWHNFAIQYKAALGRKVILVNGASGGAEFYPNGDTNNWYTSGTLYAACAAKVASCLAFTGKSTIKAVLLNLGVNDLRSANTTADIQTGVNSYFTRVMTDYPYAPILINQIGRTETVSIDSRSYTIRRMLIDKAVANDNVHMVSAGLPFISVAGYKADNLHFTQASFDIIGASYSRWFRHESLNKWARSIVCLHHDDLSLARKTEINTFINSIGSSYFNLEVLSLFKTTTKNNIYLDWTFNSFNLDGSASPAFTANDSILFGSNRGLAIGFVSSYFNSKASQTDLVCGALLKTNTSAGSNAVLFGRNDGTNVIRVAQSTTVANIHANCTLANQLNGTDSSLAANTLHSTARNGGTQYYIKGSTVQTSAATASSGACSAAIHLGYYFDSGGASFPFGGSGQAFFAGKYSTFDMSTFNTALQTLIANW